MLAPSSLMLVDSTRDSLEVERAVAVPSTARVAEDIINGAGEARSAGVDVAAFKTFGPLGVAFGVALDVAKRSWSGVCPGAAREALRLSASSAESACRASDHCSAWGMSCGLAAVFCKRA